jgi:hypothetical protein
MTRDEAIESLSYLTRSEDMVENFSIRIMVNGEEKSVEPLGFGVHSAHNAITAIVTADNIAPVSQVFFRRFER